MGILDFSSSSETRNIDESRTVEGGAQDGSTSVVGGGAVTVTDGNAIQNMFQVTMAALKNQQKIADDALGLNESSLAFAEKVKNPLGDNVKRLGLYFTVATVIVFVAAVQFRD